MARSATKLRDDLDTQPVLRDMNLLDSASADSQDLRLGFLIHDVSRLRRSAFDQFMKPLGVTRSQWWVIAHLSRQDGMMQSDLATLLDVGKVTLGGLVDRLEAGGWVDRRPHPTDRRVKHVFLTDKANLLIREMRAAEQMHNKAVLKGFSRDERTALTEMLARLKRNLSSGAMRKRRSTMRTPPDSPA